MSYYPSSLSDEFYTYLSTVSDCPFLSVLAGKDVFCSFDNEYSSFVRFCQKNRFRLGINSVSYCASEFRSNESYEILSSLKNPVIFSNPPFYCWTRVIDYYRSLGVPVLILGRFAYNRYFFERRLSFCVSPSFYAWFRVPDISLFKMPGFFDLDSSSVRVNNLAWFYCDWSPMSLKDPA